MIDLAYRAYSHSYRLDPIVRSLMDTDFYKFLMGQVIWKKYIWKKHHAVDVTFSLINRDPSIRLAEMISEQELREQLDHARSLQFTSNELIWLQGNTFYGIRGMFDPDYISFLRSFRLPEYELRVIDGQFELHFPGRWAFTTMWEIPALSIITELRNRAALRQLGRFDLDVLYARAKTKLWDKLHRLRPLPQLNLTDFGTRRRHSFLWQEWAVLAAHDVLGHGFTGTSNALLAMKHGFEAKGTNAHERPMVAAALAQTDEELLRSQYDVLAEWASEYQGALLIALPDTFGTTQFLANAPEWVANWGIRHDSKDPFAAGEEAIDWWRARGRDPLTKLNLFTDGLDADKIIALHGRFYGRSQIGYGWGTLLSNDFRNCHPDISSAGLDPFSLVCKVTTVNGRSAVKLSDNYGKATGSAEEIERYRRVFGTAGLDNAPVIV